MPKTATSGHADGDVPFSLVRDLRCNCGMEIDYEFGELPLRPVVGLAAAISGVCTPDHVLRLNDRCRHNLAPR